MHKHNEALESTLAKAAVFILLPHPIAIQGRPFVPCSDHHLPPPFDLHCHQCPRWSSPSLPLLPCYVRRRSAPVAQSHPAETSQRVYVLGGPDLTSK